MDVVVEAVNQLEDGIVAQKRVFRGVEPYETSTLGSCL